MLLGRERELREIAASLRGGRGLAIRGDAGIGKTELWRAALTQLENEGFLARRVVATETARLIPGGALAALAAEVPSRERLPSVLRALARADGRLVLGVDDAHLLDDESATAVLDFAVAGGCVLLTVRGSETAPDAIARFWKDQIGAALELGALSAEAAAALVEAVVGSPVDALTQERLHAASGGNPLLVRELVEHGLSQGRFVDVAGVRAWPGEIAPGPEVTALITRRLSALDPAVRALAERIAVGGPLPRSLLLALSGPLAFDAARRARVVRERRHGSALVWDLAHPLHAPVLAGALPVERTRHVLEQLVAAAEPLLASESALEVPLAAWLVRLSDRSRPELLVAAAERAFARAEVGLAERIAEAALAAGADAAARLLLLRVRAFLGSRSDAIPAAPDGEDEAGCFQTAMARADRFLVGLGSRDHALAALRDAETRIVGPRRREAAAHALVIRAYGSDRIEPLLDEADALLADDAPPAAVARTALALGPALTLVGRPLDAIATLEQGMAAADAAESFSPYVRDRLHSSLVQTLLLAGQLRDAQAEALRRHGEAEAAGDRPSLSTWSLVLGQALLWGGRPHEAARRFAEALALFGAFDVVGYSSWCRAELALCMAWIGRDPDQKTAGQAPPASIPPQAALLEPMILYSLAQRALAAGELREAELRARRTVARAAATGQRLPQLLGEHLRLRMRPTRARALQVARLAARCQGALAAALGHGASALASEHGDEIEAAGAELAALGFVPLAAEWFLRAAQAHERRGATAAARRCRGRAEEQRSLLDAKLLVSGLSRGPEPLTPAEQGVARLAGQGLTNREIAKRLDLSIRTVHAHLRAAYGKTGVSSRQALASVLRRVQAGEAREPNG